MSLSQTLNQFAQNLGRYLHASVKLETEMSHEFHDLFRPGLQKALIIGTLIKA